MRLSNEEALEEILRKSDEIRRRREKRKLEILSACVVMLFAGIALTIYRFAGGIAGRAAETAYGAFLLSPEAGGYILVGVMAFAAGILLMVILQTYQRNRKKDPEE